MASLGDVRIQQPVIDGHQWPSTGPLPLSDRLENEFRGTFSADSSIYNPSPQGSFTAQAILRAKVFEDTFTRTLTNEYGTPDLGVAAPRALSNPYDFSINGELVVPDVDGEFAVDIGPTADIGEFYFDFQYVTDLYIFGSMGTRFRESNGFYYAPEFEVYNDLGTPTITLDVAGSANPSLTLNEWYRVRFYYNLVDRRAKIRIWDRDDPEPSTWDIDITLSNRTSGALNSITDNGTLYIGWWADNTGPEKKVDNLALWSWGTKWITFFTADAYLLNVGTATFTADAVIQATTGTFEVTFTADAYLVVTVVTVPFTANAWLKKTVAGTFTANSRLVATDANTFTADAWFLDPVARTFTANAYIFRPLVVNPVNNQIISGLKKTTTLHILRHRERPLPTYLPPRTPDAEDVPDDGLGGPPCLPPCPGAGAGFGTGFGANGGAIVTVITKCDNCGTYFNDGDNWIGRGPIGSGTHCGCEASHSQASHTNRMWIEYTTVPSTRFRMRAKMVWDVGSDPNLQVNVYGSAFAPDIALDECDSSFASMWDTGLFVGRMSFSADGNGSIGERDVWFQEAPSELVIDPGAIQGNTFRFAAVDEGQYYRAEFKAANVQITVD